MSCRDAKRPKFRRTYMKIWKCSGQEWEKEDKTWNAVIRQALIAGYLSKDVENYGLLKVTDAGKKIP